MQFSVPFIRQAGAPNRQIGFRDVRHMIVLIPLLAFAIPLVFYGVRFQGPAVYTWQLYLHTLAVTALIWVGNRQVMIWARSRYPDFSHVSKRICIQSAAMFAYTLVATCMVGFLLQGMCDVSKLPFSTRSLGENLFNANATSLFCTLTVGAIYESRYFMSELRRSVEEKELLKRESLNAQLDALRTQINPHFLFNNLNTLTAIIPDEPAKAVKFVQQLSKVYRHILEVKDEPSIPLRDELSVLASYAFLLQTRFGKNLHITIDIGDELLSRHVAPLSLQLLMENAIKHNVVSEDHPLFIHVFAKDGQLVISNNLQLKKQVAESTGIGLENVRRRSGLLTNKPIEVVNGPENFIVAIPLIQN